MHSDPEKRGPEVSLDRTREEERVTLEALMEGESRIFGESAPDEDLNPRGVAQKLNELSQRLNALNLPLSRAARHSDSKGATSEI